MQTPLRVVSTVRAYAHGTWVVEADIDEEDQEQKVPLMPINGQVTQKQIAPSTPSSAPSESTAKQNKRGQAPAPASAAKNDEVNVSDVPDNDQHHNTHALNLNAQDEADCKNPSVQLGADGKESQTTKRYGIQVLSLSP